MISFQWITLSFLLVSGALFAYLIPFSKTYLRNLGFDQGDAYRKREPCIGTHEHCHDPNLHEDNHAETRQRPDDVREQAEQGV